jgi:predicted Zn-dependent protease
MVNARQFMRGGDRRFRVWPLALFSLFLAYYWITNRNTVPVTGRTQIVGMSPREELALGLQSYSQILNQASIVSTGPEAEMVREVGRKLAAVSDNPGLEWEFNLIDSGEVNAFCLPGGKVAVYTGILPVAANRDGLAVIMGHEIAHAIARHGAERMAHQRIAQIGQVALGTAVGEMDSHSQRLVLGAFGIGAQFGVLLPFSRKHELEADRIGLHYVAKGCFDPREAPKLWERMARASRGSPSEFMSTHPSHETRISQFHEWMPEALNLRAQSCRS